MKPVRTNKSNLVYYSENPEISDLHCQRIRVGHIRSVWRLSKEERAHIAAGGNICLDILTEPVPPLLLTTTSEDGIGEDNLAFQERIAQLKREYEATTDDERTQSS